MMSRLASAATEAALGANLARLNMQEDYYQYQGQDLIPVGTVCHEKTLGDYACFVNIQEGTPELGGRLWCDYKMIDTDFLLLPSVAQYFLNTSQGVNRAADFLATSMPSDGGTALNANRTYGGGGGSICPRHHRQQRQPIRLPAGTTLCKGACWECAAMRCPTPMGQLLAVVKLFYKHMRNGR